MSKSQVRGAKRTRGRNSLDQGDTGLSLAALLPVESAGVLPLFEGRSGSLEIDRK
jgi:hypothetical protein